MTSGNSFSTKSLSFLIIYHFIVQLHLRNLERIGLIRGWKKGKFTYYDLEKETLRKYVELFDKELNIKK